MSALDPAQRDLGDMDPAAFRRHAAAVTERIARYLETVPELPVVPAVRPGEVRAALPSEPPESPEPFEAILADFDRLIPPHSTHWQHPGFLAYFPSNTSGPGVLGEFLAAALNLNAMLWRTGPAATELEQLSLDWLRQLIGLPDDFIGEITDTASASTLYALAAAREAAADLRIREQGLAGRLDMPQLRVYCSEEAHSSVDKAVLTLGLGLVGLRRLPTDAEYRLDVAALKRAIAEDRARGVRPLAVVATVGTTSVTAVDPVAAIADVCEREELWLHVDAAFAGVAGMIPELRWIMDGTGRADSLVVNPHKWMLVPLDCSAFFTRRPDVLRRAFSLTPEYLTTTVGDDVFNLMDYGVSLGRRFRALKLWFVLRYFGAAGLRARFAEHIRLGQLFRQWVDDAPDFERLAPAHFSVVCFRWHPRGQDDEAALDAANARLLERVNAAGDVFLSHTKVRGRYALRVAVGNIRTREEHVARAWELIREHAGK